MTIRPRMAREEAVKRPPGGREEGREGGRESEFENWRPRDT
jgi:hypothetical protein